MSRTSHKKKRKADDAVVMSKDDLVRQYARSSQQRLVLDNKSKQMTIWNPELEAKKKEKKQKTRKSANGSLLTSEAVSFPKAKIVGFHYELKPVSMKSIVKEAADKANKERTLARREAELMKDPNYRAARQIAKQTAPLPEFSFSQNTLPTSSNSLSSSSSSSSPFPTAAAAVSTSAAPAAKKKKICVLPERPVSASHLINGLSSWGKHDRQELISDAYRNAQDEFMRDLLRNSASSSSSSSSSSSPDT